MARICSPAWRRACTRSRRVTGGGRGAAPNTPTEWAAAEVTVSGQDLDVPLTLQPGVADQRSRRLRGLAAHGRRAPGAFFRPRAARIGRPGPVERRRPRGCGRTLHVRGRRSRHVSLRDDVERASGARQMDAQDVHRERPRGIRGAAAREPERNGRVDGHLHRQADEPRRRVPGSRRPRRRPTTTSSCSRPTGSTGRPARDASA